MNDKCKGFLGKLCGHSFKVVVTKSKSHLNIEEIRGSITSVSELADKYRDETFKIIYCKRCGKIVENKA